MRSRRTRELFKSLAAEGRTVFVSSHLMSEMALTADHLIIIGRGRLLADMPTAEFIGANARGDVFVRSPRLGDLAGLLRARGATVAPEGDGGQAEAAWQADTAGPGRAVRARDVLLSEWTKLRSVRSTYWALLVAAVVALAAGMLLAFVAGRQAHLLDPVAFSFIGWAQYPVLAVGILGVLAFTSECTTGQIRTTFTAVPRRLAVLAAKTAVVGSLILVFGESLAVASFALTQVILSRQRQGVSLSHPGVPGAVLAAGFVLAVVAVTGAALGAAIRHTAGAVAALPAVFYLPLILLQLPSPWNHRIDRFTLPVAAYQVVSLHPATNLLAPALSMLVLIAWPAIALAAAAILITRRAA